MKKRKTTIYIATAVLALCVTVSLLFGNPKECCLCNNPSYDAPCLLDLETGDILELRLDCPSATYDSNGQADVETFSFIRFGNVTGTKQTAPNVVTLKIPMEDKSRAPALCRNCRKLLPKWYAGRYALVNLTQKELFPITTGREISVCRYTVRVSQEETHLSVLIAAPHH